MKSEGERNRERERDRQKERERERGREGTERVETRLKGQFEMVVCVREK